MTIALLFDLAPSAVIVAAVVHFWRGRVGKHQMDGWLALAYALSTVGNVITHDRTWAGISAGWCAVFAWLWWTSGDDTKRRLKKLTSGFRAVLRIAPKGA
ncbi:hypothetical protein GCM10010400_30570 [Streptomyces aculeolatus]|uniref:hypothetical protein n=1 Tax=Streptomyces aculeolatus TaxID=270689 RepID=UPI001CED01C8|nr:hypothetical protein [Streptomyces aculeolatus]